MAKKKSKCTHLNVDQSEQLARLIIELGKNGLSHGTKRPKKIAAPTGAVILF